MKIRKKNILDGIDKEILRVLLIRRPLVTRKIAQVVGLTSSAITPRLRRLKNEGILKISKEDKQRVFKRKFGNRIVTIRAPRNIFWDLDLIKNKDNTNEKP